MKTRLAVLFVLLLAAPLWAAKDWYVYYEDALRLIDQKRYDQALKSLQEARAIKPESGRLRTYGMYFADYYPYYYEGICHQALGDYDNAIRMFGIEADRKKIQEKRDLWRDLLNRKTEVEAARDRQLARKLRQEVEQKKASAIELVKAKKYEEALARLAEAIQAASSGLDEETTRDLREQSERIRAEMNKTEQATDRSRRVTQALADGHRLLEEGKDTEAVVRFKEVLDLEPGSSAAQHGKRQADDRILARTTRASRQARYDEGRGLYEAGKYDEAILPLTDAATDATIVGARELLEKTQSVIDGIRKQKVLSKRVTQLLAEGERLYSAGRFAEAAVRFESARVEDPANVRVRERLAAAEQRTNEAIYDRIMKPRPPDLIFFEPSELETQDPTVLFNGFANDDRRIVRVEFLAGGQLLKQIEVSPDEDSAKARNFRVRQTLDLAVGQNEFVVRAVDSQGQTTEQSFALTRTLRIHERPWFLPAAAATSLSLFGFGFVVQRVRQRRAVRRRFNPYIAGAPILNDAMFFGRQKLLSRILNVLHHNSLMITGERRIGKTTLLYQLKKALEADDTTEYRFFPVFIDLQGVAEDSFFHALMGDVLDELHLSPDDLAALHYREDEERYDGRDFSHDLQRVVEALKRRTAKKVKLALLIDEVDVLNSFSERINQRLRSIFMKTFSEHLVAIMSGVGVKRIWTSEGSPWYNFFDEIELAPFSREEAESLIREPVQAFFRWEPEAVEAILRWSGGKPYLVQKICIHAVNRMLEEGRSTVTARDVEAVRNMNRTFAEDEALPQEQAASV
jgi:tetratricopeptide (TPR) repeat protein